MDVNNFQTNTQNTEQSDVNIQQQSQQAPMQQPAPQYTYQPGVQQTAPQYTYQQPGVQQMAPQYTYQQPGVQQTAPQYTYQQQSYGNSGQYGAAPVYQQAPSQSSGNGLAVGGMICGIVSIVFACCCGVGSILGIVGLVLSLVSKKSSGKLSGMALAGAICSVVGLLFSLVYVIYCIINGAYGLEMMEMFEDSYYYY